MLTKLQKDILDKLTFAESLTNICEETMAAEPAVRDDLRYMIDKRWVQVMGWDENKQDFLPTLHYDSDNMHETRYMITARGWKMLEK
jgi:hypothetical protein